MVMPVFSSITKNTLTMKSLLSVFTVLLLSALGIAQPCYDVAFQMTTGPWASEISWSLADEFGNIVYEESGYTDYSSSSSVICLSEGCYILQMYDSFGDGWNGGELETEMNGLGGAYSLLTGNYQALPFQVNSNDTCDFGTLQLGCTDPLAANYDSTAVLDDGSCYYFQDIYGCMDSTALNYNPWATIDDGSCVYPVECEEGETPAQLYVCVFQNGSNVGLDIVSEQGDTIFSQQGFDDLEIMYVDVCLEDSTCYTAYMSNNMEAEGWYGGYWWLNLNGAELIQDALDPGYESQTVDFSIDGTCGEVYGCTDPNATNFNPAATQDDGSCVYPVGNDLCADALFIQPGQYLVDNSGAVENEGILGECWNSGGGEGEQTSVWYTFTTPADPVRIVLEASGDGTWTFTDTQFGLFEECGGEMIACDGNGGDGLFSRLEFQCGTLEPNTQYYLVIDGWFGDNGTCLLDYEWLECEDQEIYGCTDPLAVNYDPAATSDDGSCIYPPDSCETNQVDIVFSTGPWGYEISFGLYNDENLLVFGSNGFQSQQTYNFFDCWDSGCYTLIMEDTFGDGWNGALMDIYADGVLIASGVTLDEGEYGTYTFGIDEEDCDGNEPVYGCTDPWALNFNPNATIDDGSCLYDSMLVECIAYFEVDWVDQEEDVVYLSAVDNGPDHFYLWEFGDGSSSTEQFPTHVYAEDGLYLICLSVFYEGEFGYCEDFYCDTISYYSGPMAGGNGNPGGVVDGGFTLNVLDGNALGIQDEDDLHGELNVYPNPSDDHLWLDFQTSRNLDVIVNLFDMRGRVVHSRTIATNAGEQLWRLETSDMDQGTYFLEVRTASDRIVRKVVLLR
jgi:hypothetical protein